MTNILGFATVLDKMKWSIWSIITSFMARGITKLALFYLLKKIIFIKLASNQMQQKFLNRKVQMPQRKRNINIKYACSQRSAAVLVNISFVNPFCVLSLDLATNESVILFLFLPNLEPKYSIVVYILYFCSQQLGFIMMYWQSFKIL